MEYNDYNSYLRRRFGTRVYRIALDAGFSCPNRDGTSGTGGCLFCNADGSRSGYVDPAGTAGMQLSSRIAYLKAKAGAPEGDGAKRRGPKGRGPKFIAYFQAFTNTYADTARLKAVYDSVLPFEDVVGISIGTRPDCVDREKMELIAYYSGRYDVWVEYGLQSIHDRTLEAIGRGHGFGDFLGAFGLAREFGLSVSVHIIIGLPGESRADIIETAKKISGLGADGVKIHLLHVLKGSRLESLYRQGQVRLLGQDEYAELVCDFLEHLSPGIVVQRLTGEGTGESHIAPSWALDKTGTISKIRSVMEARKSCQGSRYFKGGSKVLR